MKNLLKVADDERNAEWERSLLEKLVAEKVSLIQEQPVNGPDQFPYFLVEYPSKATEEPVENILGWLSEKGIGFVLNPNREPCPDLVLTYGMIWGLRHFGNIWAPVKSEEFQVGDPSEEILPTYARKIIQSFLQDQGVLQPRILAANQSKGLDFCFSIESLENPPEEEYEGIAEALSWFIPPNFSVALASEKDLSGFAPL